MSNMLKSLKLLEEIETAKGHLYEQLEDRFLQDEEASSLFSRFVIDQVAQRNVVQYQYRIILKNLKNLAETHFDLHQLEEIRNGLADYIQTDHKPTLAEAAETALRFESRLKSMYESGFFDGHAQALGPFFRSLEIGCKKHTQLLDLILVKQATVRPALPEPARLRKSAKKVKTVAEAPPAETAPEIPPPLNLLDSLSLQMDFSHLIQLCDILEEGVYIVDRNRRISYWNSAAGRISGYAEEDMIGRCCWENRLLHIDETGCLKCHLSCPIAEAIRTGLPSEEALFLQHRDGHRLPIQTKVQPLLDQSGEVIGAIEVFKDFCASSISPEKVAELEKLSYLDALTGLANRRYLEVALVSRVSDLQHHNWSFGLILLGLNNFETINKRHGRTCGDRLLRSVSLSLAVNARGADLVGRWGGDEFMVVVPNAEVLQITMLAEKLRAMVETTVCEWNGEALRVTASLGIALAHPEDTLETLVGRSAELMIQCQETKRPPCR